MLTKPTFKNFIFYTFISNTVIYFFQFLLYKDKVNYFLCTEIKSYDLYAFSRKFVFIYPESCDLNAYLRVYKIYKAFTILKIMCTSIVHYLFCIYQFFIGY